MIITISGTQNTGKSTVIKDFLAEFPMYKEHPEKLRDYIKANNLEVNQKTCKESQRLILDWYCNVISQYNRTSDNVIIDRSPLDCIVYTLRAYYQGGTDIDAPFIMECIEKVKNALRNVDIVFFIPRLKNDGIKIVEDGFRDTDEEFIMQVDSIFKKIIYEQIYTGKCEIFDPNDQPALLEIHGTRKQRIDIMKLYVETSTGGLITSDKPIIDQAELDNVQRVLRHQEAQAKSLDFIKEKMKRQ